MSGEMLPRCPLPTGGDPGAISLAHGEGGRLMRDLLRGDILPALCNEYLADQGDAAVLPPLAGRPVFTTDSFVVSPLFFPGGDIGSLAVNGTINDLAVAGARPLWLSLAMILEEGFPRSLLKRVLASVAEAAGAAKVRVVTGDTKVVPRGAADGLFINTAGIGQVMVELPGPKAIQIGDALIVSGPIGRHGLAVLAEREQLAFAPPIQSDSAPLFPAVEALCAAGVPVKALRDATRGGVAAVLHEWAGSCGQSLSVDVERVPVTADVRGGCELLGLDPLHVACEGTMVVAVPASAVDSALSQLRALACCRQAACIGTVVPPRLAPVLVRRATQREVPLDEPLGAPLPRIC